MNRRTIYFQAFLCLLGASASLYVSLVERPSADDGGNFHVLDIEAEDLQSVHYQWPKGDALVEKDGDDHKVTVQIAPPKSDDSTVERQTHIFPAGRSVTSALAKLTPLIAMRALPDVDEAKRKEMGLLSGERTLTLTTSKDSYVLHIGNATFGKKSHFAEREGEDTVYLIPGRIIRGLQSNPARMQNTRLLQVSRRDVVGFSFTIDGSRLAFSHQDREDAKKRRFVDDDGEESEGANALFTSITGLRALRYVDNDKVAGHKPLLQFSVEIDGQKPAELSVFTVGEDSFARFGKWTAKLPKARSERLLKTARKLKAAR